MATTTEIARRIDTYLRVLQAEVDDLPNVAREWDEWTEANRASFALDWAHLMADYLTQLDDYCRSGDLSLDQGRRYQALSESLQSQLPTIERLDLYRPSCAPNLR